MGSKADRLRSLLASGRKIADQTQSSSLKADEVLADLEQREDRERRRAQAQADDRRRRFPATGGKR